MGKTRATACAVEKADREAYAANHSLPRISLEPSPERENADLPIVSEMTEAEFYS